MLSIFKYRQTRDKKKMMECTLYVSEVESIMYETICCWPHLAYVISKVTGL